MPRFGSTPFAFPEFRGATRRLVLWNLAAYFALAFLGLTAARTAQQVSEALAFSPAAFLHGSVWQPLTYSLMHPGLYGAFFELLSLWFLAGFLETMGNSNWVTGLYTASVLGTAASALAIELVLAALGHPIAASPLYGCFGGIFGLLAAIGLLYGDTQFLLFFTIGIKARYLVVIYALVSIAMLFGQQKIYAFSQLGGALAALAWIRLAPRKGFSFALSEGFYALRNRYYRWKRRRTARKFEVYMRSQGRTIHLDGQGRRIDNDQDDPSRWN
ncbi:MAG: rhomboid family intramembrane serine protease [Terracidiphilus sp.]